MKVEDYINKICVVYDKSPMFKSGAVVRVLGVDTTTDRYAISLLVVDLRKDNGDTNLMSLDFNSAINSAVWIRFEDIKEIINFTRPESTIWLRFKLRVRQIWMRGLKVRSLESSENSQNNGLLES